ncbi:hypothetical protein FRC14_001100, partial [Serendipita sp. 396]
VCCICRHPFVEPTSSSTCGHTFCRDCITEALSHTLACPVDRSSLHHDDLKPAHVIIRNLVDELLVECPNKADGCTQTFQRHTVAAHIRHTCDYTEVPCPSDRCKSKVLRKDLATHQLSCDRRTIQCSACLQAIPMSDAQVHTDQCPKGTTTCPDCETELLREEMDTHEDTCPLFTILCSHSSVGCEWVGIREDLSFHLSSCSYESLKGFFTIHAKENSNLRAENAVLHEEICTLRAQMREMTTDMTKARQALGPWFKPTSLSPPSSSQAPERVTGRRRLSSPLTSGMLAFPDTSRDPSGPSERGITNSANASNSVNPASPTLLPVDSGLAPTITLQDFTPRTQAHSPIPPINMETTLEGSLGSLRHSIVTLSTEFESLSRRQDMHYTTELLRLHEEVASLRATVHGLRMQVSRNDRPYL